MAKLTHACETSGLIIASFQGIIIGHAKRNRLKSPAFAMPGWVWQKVYGSFYKELAVSP